MTAPAIGILSPGAMGSGLGRAWQRGGARVLTTVAGRSVRTRELADGLELMPSLLDVVTAADIVISVGPPGQAAAMANAIAECCERSGRRPLVADLNAVSPRSAVAISARLERAGCSFVDGTISGPVPGPATNTRLYLSGRDAAVLAARPAAGMVAHVVGASPGAASAIKMCTSSMSKGFTALLLQALRTAAYFDVAEAVVADLEIQFGGVMDGIATRIATGGSKANRYLAEMLEIARTQGEAGASALLFEAIAQVYDGVDHTRLGALTPEQADGLTDLPTVLALLNTDRATVPAGPGAAQSHA